MGIIQICPWGVGGEVEESGMNDGHESLEPKYKLSTFVGHTGPIYSISFSPDGKFLATGGNDALVGLWDVKSMTCQATISSRTKFRWRQQRRTCNMRNRKNCRKKEERVGKVT